jgi:hypothetical protein
LARDTGIADRLRAAGLKVIEVDGWRTRGSETFSPRGSVDHHTAGSSRGNAPSLGVCINGRADLPGPLCQVLVARDLTCYVIAAGRANHAGSGGWKGLSGNSSVYGVERENVGTTAEPWRPEQTVHAAKVHAALIQGKATADFVARHAEWAPTRKVDTHSISGAQLRLLVAQQGDGMAFTPAQEQKIVTAAQLIVDGAPMYGVPPTAVGVARVLFHLDGLKVTGQVDNPMKTALLAQMKTDLTATLAAINAIPAKVVAALPPASTGGLTEAQVEAACEKAIKDTGLLGLLPGQ